MFTNNLFKEKKMTDPKLRFNREELKVIHDYLYVEKYETDLMSAEIGLSRAKENGVNLSSWQNHVDLIKKKIKTNKILINKINKYFGYNEE
jgi:hypothetical protein